MNLTLAQLDSLIDVIVDGLVREIEEEVSAVPGKDAALGSATSRVRHDHIETPG